MYIYAHTYMYMHIYIYVRRWILEEIHTERELYSILHTQLLYKVAIYVHIYIRMHIHREPNHTLFKWEMGTLTLLRWISWLTSYQPQVRIIFSSIDMLTFSRIPRYWYLHHFVTTHYVIRVITCIISKYYRAKCDVFFPVLILIQASRQIA